MSRSRILAVLVFGAAASIATPPALAHAEDDAPHAAVDPDTRTRARLLHLVGEGVVRGTSRFVGDHWEIERGNGWTALPTGAVAEAKLEKDVLKEARSQLADVRRAGPDEKVEVARWLAREGLLKESFDEIEELLAAHPDHDGTLALLRDLAPTIGMPKSVPLAQDVSAAIEPLLSYAANAPMSLREMAVVQLEDIEDREELHAALRRDLRHENGARRQLALIGLRRLFPTQLDEDLGHDLLHRALYDRYEDVRRHASLNLGATHELGLELNVVQALASPNAAVRVHAVQALGAMKASSPAAVGALVSNLTTAAARGDGWSGPRAFAFFGTQRAFVQGFEAEVAQNAVIADPLVGTVQEGATIDVRVLGVSSRSPYAASAERGATVAALESITGASPGTSAKAWSRWWKDNEADWLASHAAPATSTASTSPYR